jgi:3-oxoacyl-[acyl-carrier-protein] synthase-3
MSEKNPVRCSVIAGTGSYVPEHRVPNSAFHRTEFFDSDGSRFHRSAKEIAGKLEQISGIAERRYVGDDLLASDMAQLAAEQALEDSGLDPETLDCIIVAHNFGDVRPGSHTPDLVPSLASRVKQKLRIINPRTIPYDLPFGCPGWVQGLIQAHSFFQAGHARRALVVGTETLSRVYDPSDRDSMIYADGAGAAVLEAVELPGPAGILAHAVRSDTLHHASMLWMGPGFGPEHKNGDLYLKMDGHRLYEYALKRVPGVVKESLEKAGLSLSQVAKVLIHQANAKMDRAILKRIHKICGAGIPGPQIMPMTISWLGNSSVATVPTLLDLLLREQLDGHRASPGDVLVLASVGAGMNINSLVYRIPAES